jgi:hypothetical protein
MSSSHPLRVPRISSFKWFQNGLSVICQLSTERGGVAAGRRAAPVVDDLMLKVKVEVDLCFVFDMIHESDKSVNLLSS